MAGKGFGFHRDVVNSELDILVGGTIVATFSSDGGVTVANRNTTTVVQASNHQTGVTINGSGGTIQLFDVALSAAAESQFTVTNSFVSANDVVILSIGDYNDGAGTPMYSVSDVSDGSFKITISNPGAGDGYADDTTINFVVIKSV